MKNSTTLDLPRLEAAFAIVRLLHFAATQESAAQSTLRSIAEIVPVAKWGIYLVNKPSTSDEGDLETLAVQASGAASAKTAAVCNGAQATATAEATLIETIERRAMQRAVACGEISFAAETTIAALAVPLVHEARVMGVLGGVRILGETASTSDSAVSDSLEAASELWDKEDVRFLDALAAALAAALARTGRIAEAERLLQIDDLTKLHNARYLRERLVSEIKRARRYNSQVAVLFFDLDNFKSINDEYGHLVGSHLLIEIGATIRTLVRDTDVVARYGGDEFVLMLPETPLERAAQVAERLRTTLSEQIFTGGRRLRLRVTASFGVASYPEHAQSPQQLVAAADAAMYRAKAQQRDCVCIAD